MCFAIESGRESHRGGELSMADDDGDLRVEQLSSDVLAGQWELADDADAEAEPEPIEGGLLATTASTVDDP